MARIGQFSYTTIMKMLVFGANGKVGNKVVMQLLLKGHLVTAFVHGASVLPEHQQLSVISGDIYDKNAVYEAVGCSEVIVSALGSWGTPRKDILTSGMKHIIPAMEAAGLRRIVSLTGADARAAGDPSTLIHTVSHSMLGLMAGKVLADGEKHIELLEQSSLNYTVIRSPVMNESGRAAFSLVNKRPYPWQTIHRDAVVMAMAQLAETDEYARETPFIYRV